MSERLLTTWQVGPYPIAIYEVDNLVEEGCQLDGQFDRSVRPYALRVAAKCKGRERWLVIFHELTHFALHLGSIEVGAKEEGVCDLVGLAFCEALKDLLPSPPETCTF